MIWSDLPAQAGSFHCPGESPRNVNIHRVSERAVSNKLTSPKVALACSQIQNVSDQQEHPDSPERSISKGYMGR